MYRLLIAFLLLISSISCNKEIVVGSAPKFVLSVTAGTGGLVSNTGGEFDGGSNITITATPNSGYIFSEWSNGSTENPLTLSINSNISVSAIFSAIPSYNITLTANPGGSVTGGGSYIEGTQVSISATPNSGYIFSSWSDGSTDSTRTITISENITLTANFTEIIYSFTLSLEAGTGGNVSTSGGVYEQGTVVTITATPDSGYTFGSWSDGSTEQTRTITITQNLELTANFETIPSFSISLNANSGGSVSGAGTYDQGVQVTISATPDSGYTFGSWSDGSTEQTRTITITQNLELTANFTQNTTSTGEGSTSGSTSSGGGSTSGSTSSGSNLCGGDPNGVSPSGDITCTFTISIASGGGGTIEPVPGTYTFNKDSQVNFTAIPDEGYQFVRWTGSFSSMSSSGSVSMTANHNITAVFELIPPSLSETCSLNDEQTGSLYELRIPNFDYLNSGDQIMITMYSSTLSNNQVKNISLYKNDEFIYSWGNWLTLTNNQKSLVIPSSLTSSSCYNIRVFEEGPSASSTDDESYISELFEIRVN